jgi:hypothetical protein
MFVTHSMFSTKIVPYDCCIILYKVMFVTYSMFSTKIVPYYDSCIIHQRMVIWIQKIIVWWSRKSDQQQFQNTDVHTCILILFIIKVMWTFSRFNFIENDMELTNKGKCVKYYILLCEVVNVFFCCILLYSLYMILSVFDYLNPVTVIIETSNS